jgi:hypothetical protein
MANIKYAGGWTDPRGFFGKPQDPSKWETNNYTSPEMFIAHVEKQMQEMRNDVANTVRAMQDLKGFYAWLMHAYPETIVQYKAIQELQQATRESAGKEVASAPMYSFGGTP